MYDIGIIGAGPAGATLARLLGNEFKIIILDRRELKEVWKPDGLEKCCGGLLAPDAQKLLSVFGLGLPKKVMTDPQLFSVRSIDILNSRERFYQRHYININREEFDRWLVSLIPGSVEVKTGFHLKNIRKNIDNITISSEKNGYKEEFQVKILIGADGASSTVRNMFFRNRKKPEVYVSIQESFRVKEALPYFSAIFDPEVTDFYSWTIPKEDLILLGTAIPAGKDAKKRFGILKDKLNSRYNFNFHDPVKKCGALIFRPTAINQITTGHDRIALIGEAAGWISPSSAEGLSYAFRSALYLSQAIRKDFNNYIKYYNKFSRPLKLNIFLKNRKKIFMYNPLLRNLIMKTGINSI